MPTLTTASAQSLHRVAERFLGPQASLDIAPLGAGLINTTYRVDSPQGSFVLQRVNGAVFPAPRCIMANLSRLQRLSAARPELEVRLPNLVAGPVGEPFYEDADGSLWRLMEYIYPSRTLSTLENPTQAAEVGSVLGNFHRLSAELNPGDLSVTLPGLHHTPTYLAALDAATPATLDDGAIIDALAFIATRRSLAHALEDARRDGLTPIRVIHGDPKIDNLLFDPDSDRALCLIDLDTVQPGLVHHDIGDCLRSCCNRIGESADGARRVCFDIDICRDLLRAYADRTRHLFSAAERGLFYTAIRLVPFELGMRFLTDHLQGDRYFRVRARGENLRKAQVQFALVADIERNATAIEAIVRDSFGPGPST
ncbi:MAG: aminoglycoside phosphotransferase family protein [Thiohalocapsa sp.]